MRILFDTEVLVSYLTCIGNHEENELISLIDKALEKHECALSVKSAGDIHYRLKDIFLETETVKNLSEMLDERFSIIGIDDTDVIDSEINDYEQTILINTAIQNDCDLIVAGNTDIAENHVIKTISVEQLRNLI